MSSERAFVRLLGRFESAGRNGAPLRFATERSRRLLVLLILAGGTAIPRERLTGALWEEGDETRLRNSLNTEVWRLRRSLAEAGEDTSDWLAAVGPDLAFRAGGGVEVDVLRFDALLREAERSPDARSRTRALEAAIELYGGELAPGIYADWCLLAREAYRSRFLGALETLLQLHRDARRWSDAIAAARRILQEDPFLEHVHRELMRCHALMGDRAAAVRHFEELRRALRRELDVEPTAETRALHDLLRLDGDATLLSPAPSPEPWSEAPRLRRIRRQLLLAARELGALSRRRSQPLDH